MKRRQRCWQKTVKIHSSNNISEEGKRGKETTRAENKELLQHEVDTNNLLNKAFIKTELNRSLKKTKMSSPGKDQICYIMINHPSEASKDILLELYNKVWEGGKLPQSWKETVVVPIRKPGKDCRNQGNYRPIALTTQHLQYNGEMVNEKLTYYIEN